jgi:hypothetical protein
MGTLLPFWRFAIASLILCAVALTLGVLWKAMLRPPSSPAHPPILLMSMCDGRWKRYSVPECGATAAQRIRDDASAYGVSRVLAHCEEDVRSYAKSLPFSEAWDKNWLDCGHAQKLLFILEHRALIEGWPGLVLYQDCKNGHLGRRPAGDATSKFRDFARYLDEAGGFLVAHQPYKHREYAPNTCSVGMGRDVSSIDYGSECQVRTAWMLFRPSLLRVFEEALDALASGHRSCRTDGEHLYEGKERGRGDQTVIHNVLFRMGLDKQLSAYDSSGLMVNSVFFFDYFNPEWTLALERARC